MVRTKLKEILERCSKFQRRHFTHGCMGLHCVSSCLRCSVHSWVATIIHELLMSFRETLKLILTLNTDSFEMLYTWKDCLIRCLNTRKFFLNNGYYGQMGVWQSYHFPCRHIHGKRKKMNNNIWSQTLGWGTRLEKTLSSVPCTERLGKQMQTAFVRKMESTTEWISRQYVHHAIWTARVATTILPWMR